MNGQNNPNLEKTRVMKRFSKYIRRSLAVLMAGGALITSTSCSDDLDVRGGITGGLNGDGLTLTLSIPEIKMINTRDGEDENTISNATVILFSNNTVILNKELSSSDFSDDSSGNLVKKTVTLGLDASQKNSMSKIYVIANANGLSLLDGSSSTTLKNFRGTPDDLEALVAQMPATGNLSSPLVMSGSNNVERNASNIDVTVNRLSSKISMSPAQISESAPTQVSGYTLEKYTVYNAAGGVQLAPMPDNPSDYTGFYDEEDTKRDLTSNANDVLYVYPSYGATVEDPESDGAFVILEAKRGDKPSYYRLNFRTKEKVEETGTIEYEPLNLLPNHWYKIVIEEILADGYESPSEAMRHPEDDGELITYQIQDHSTNVFSMVTDGIRELGVTSPVKWYSGTDTYFTVKWYSAISEEESLHPTFEITEGADWLEIGQYNENANVIDGVYPTIDNGNFKCTWTAVRDSEGKITFTLSFDKEAAGLSPQLFVNHGHKGDFKKSGNIWTYTTTDTYSEGENPNFALYIAYSGGTTGEIPLNYIVPEYTESKEGDQWVSDVDSQLGSGESFTTIGTVRKFKLNAIKEGKSAVIKVSWMGLTREIEVINNADPNYAAKLKITLKIYDGDGKLYDEIKDYWTFLNQQGRSSEMEINGGQTPRLFGVSQAQMNDPNGLKRRNLGLHFPVMYGDDSQSKLWKYEYIISSKREDSGTVNAITAHCYESSISNSNGISKTIMTYSYITKDNEEKPGDWDIDLENNDNDKIVVRFETQAAGYNYSTAEIQVIVNYVENGIGDADYVTLPVYHTGFFHFDDDFKLEEPEEEANVGYYYYEVVPMGGTYWLDRNLGAKATGMYYEGQTTSEGEPLGKPEAAGKYLTVADKAEYSSPAMIDETPNKKRVSPPGYHVPISTKWNTLMTSPDFHSTSLRDFGGSYGNYYSCGYTQYGDYIGNIYFPRSRYMNSGAPAGESASGYYWTATEAPAMEKDHMGNWLRTLLFSGNSHSFENGDVTNSQMNVRCVAGHLIPAEDMKYISLYVHNATHVYIFDKTTGAPLFTFPGKPVGTTSSANEWQYFYYTTTNQPDNLLMIFAKMESDGKVTVFTRNGNTFTKENQFSKDILKEDYAWKVGENTGTKAKYFDFCEVAKEKGRCVVENDQPTDCLNNKFMQGSKIILHWRNYYEGTPHTWLSMGNAGWNANLLNNDPWYTIATEDPSNNNNLIYEITSLKTTIPVIMLNVREGGEGDNERNKIRYCLKYDQLQPIVEYAGDTGDWHDQKISNKDLLKQGRIVTSKEGDQDVYNVYLYTEDNSNYRLPNNPEDPSNLWRTDGGWVSHTSFVKDWDINVDAPPQINLENYGINFTTPGDMGWSEWMGQVHLENKNIKIEANKLYHFSITVKSSKNSTLTIKPVSALYEDPETEYPFFGDNRISCTAGEFKFTKLRVSAGREGFLKIVLDFGGNPNQDFEITDIILMEAK